MLSGPIDELVRAEILERVPADRKTAELWLGQASRHLEASRRILDLDLAGAYSLLYDAARKSLAALMLARGYRVRSVPGAHKAVGTYGEATLGEGPYGDDVRRFDSIRRNRNRSDYGTRHFGEAEVQKHLEHAGRIHRAVREELSSSP